MSRAKCLWCDKTLVRKHHTKYERTGKFRPPTGCYSCATAIDLYATEPVATTFRKTEHGDFFECTACNTHRRGREIRQVVSRKPIYLKAGYYGDGYFCNATHARYFAVLAADAGFRLAVKPKGDGS